MFCYILKSVHIICNLKHPFPQQQKKSKCFSNLFNQNPGAFIHFRMRFKLDHRSNNFIWLIIHFNGEILHQQHIVWHFEMKIIKIYLFRYPCYYTRDWTFLKIKLFFWIHFFTAKNSLWIYISLNFRFNEHPLWHCHTNANCNIGSLPYLFYIL